MLLPYWCFKIVLTLSNSGSGSPCLIHLFLQICSMVSRLLGSSTNMCLIRYSQSAIEDTDGNYCKGWWLTPLQHWAEEVTKKKSRGKNNNPCKSVTRRRCNWSFLLNLHCLDGWKRWRQRSYLWTWRRGCGTCHWGLALADFVECCHQKAKHRKPTHIKPHLSSARQGPQVICTGLSNKI